MARDPDTMHGYYAGETILPTYGAFSDEAQLEAYERQRRRLFTDKLHLPSRLFEGARLIEFGPDSGENSLVFAMWGADLTLVEPHAKAHPVIRSYFERFGLSDRLAALDACDLETFPAEAEARFEVLDAEGFIYTIQPSSLWIEKIAALLVPEGFAVLQYIDVFGSVLELIWKVVQARYRALTGVGANEAAAVLYGTKWASIPHKRTIESWTMDVLENPFVRLAYFLDPIQLVEEMAAAGLHLHSAWPPYDGGMDVHWAKYEPSLGERLGSVHDYVGRSRLSHMLGRRHFLADVDALPDATLRALLEDVDALVDGYDAECAARVDTALARIAVVLDSPAVVAREEDTKRSLATLTMLRRLVGLLVDGRPEEIAHFSNTEPAFIENWGMPSHFAVFRRTG